MLTLTLGSDPTAAATIAAATTATATGHRAPGTGHRRIVTDVLSDHLAHA
ncbi:hypothetical protein AB0K18_09085 [Nonomuraea sp. NPDC049421]